MIKFHPDLQQEIEKPRKRLTRRRKPKINNREGGIRKCLLELVTVHGRPLCLLDDPPMAKILCLAANTDQNIFTISKLKEDIVATEDHIRKAIMAETRVRLISMTLDIVTKYARSILGINAQYVLEDKLVVRTIGMIEMEKSHTGAYIAELVVQKLEYYGIHIEQIYAATMDNGKNVVKSTKDLQNMLENILGANSDPHDAQANMDEIDDVMEEVMDMETYNDVLELLDDSDADRLEDVTMQPIDEEIGTEAIDRLIESISTSISNLNERVQNISGLFCSTHSFQLSINSAINEWDKRTGLVQKCNAVIVKLRTPNISRMINKKKLPLPVLRNQTRWGTSYPMVNIYSFSISFDTHWVSVLWK